MERLQDQEYKNWLKYCLGLNCLKDGLISFMEKWSKSLQENILQQSGVKDTDRCGTCQAKDIIVDAKNKQTSFRNRCPSNICDKMVKEIASHHIHGNKAGKVGVYWNNGKVQEWTHVHWEIAKIFMGRGQKYYNKGPTQTDAANLLTCIDQCSFCQNHHIDQGSKKFVKKIKEKRNQVMHSSSMKLSDQDLQNGLENIIQFLKDSNLSQEKDAQLALEQVSKLENLDLNITTDDIQNKEMAILSDKMRDLEHRLHIMAESYGTSEASPDYQGDARQLKMERENFIKFVEDNHLNLTEFNNFKEQTNQKITCIEGRVCNLEDRVGKIELGGSRTSGDRKGFKSGYDYKKVLNHHAQKNLPKMPEYKHDADENSDKWTATVKIGDKLYKSLSGHNTSKEAHQEAAYQALKQIGYYNQGESDSGLESSGVGPSQNKSSVLSAAPPSASPSGVLVYDASEPRVEEVSSNINDIASSSGEISNVGHVSVLNDLLSRSGFTPAKYTIEKVNGKDQATVTATVTNVLTLDQPTTKKKDAEQQVAEMILTKFKAEKPKNQSSFKESLHAYCGQQKLEMANFYTFQAKRPGVFFGCVASMSSLQGSHQISTEGDICSTYEECFQSAAETMYNLLKEVKFERIVSQRNIGHNTTPKSVISPTICSPSENISVDRSSLPIQDPVAIKKINFVSLFNEYVQKSHLSCKPDIDCKEEINNSRSKIFKGVISNFMPKFKLPIDVEKRGPPNKKEAEKDLATSVLRRVFNIDSPDRNLVKNKLQEICVKYQKGNIPKYETEHLETGCISEVTFLIEVLGDQWHTDKQNARNEVAKKALEMVREL